MHFELTLIAAALLCCLPVAFVVAVIIRKRRERRAASCSPFKDLQRRPAGESLRLKLEALDDKINEASSLLILLPLLLVYALFTQHLPGGLAPVLYFALAAIGSAFWGTKLCRLVGTRANYRLGYEGERYVGEELARLIRLGFEVYHDVPFEGFNLDHVLVGPRGVVLVETKTRRKPVRESGQKEFQVRFDGSNLQWPWGADGHGVQQAKNNAKTLANWLAAATGESVRVTPVLTLPGWMVERTAPPDNLRVLNPQEIFKVCAALPEKLSDAQIQRICHQLDQKCRVPVA